MEQKSKQSNQNEQSRIKLAFINTQVKIIESTNWPGLYTSILFNILMYIQILKYTYDYINVVWDNSSVIFSYFDLSYYETYLNGNTYISVMYTVIAYMAFYIIMFIYLLNPVLDGQINNSLLKINKICLQISSTFLYIPIAKTITNYNNCTQNNNHLLFPCLVEPVLSIQVVSYTILFIFTFVIILQSLTKYQFLQSEHSRVVRKSSRTCAFFVIFILTNQLIALYQSDLILIILLNLFILLMLIFTLLVQEFETSITKKLELCIISINIIMLIFADLNYFTPIIVPISFCVICCVFIILSIFLNRQFSLKNELQNINKWSTPVDMLKYCSGLRNLLKNANNSVHNMMINGYCDIHGQKCEQVSCPIKLSDSQITKLRMFNPESTNNKKKQTILIEQLIKKIYSQGVKFFPSNSTLCLQYAIFLYKKNMKQQALKQILQMNIEDPSLDQYYKYYRLKHMIHKQLSFKNIGSSLDMLSQMEMKQKQQDFFKLLQKTALVDLQFWGVLNQDHPDFSKLDQIGVSRIKLGQNVDQLYQQITNIGNSQRTTFLYVQYLISINKYEDQFNNIYQNLKRQFQLNQKITIQDWVNSSEPIFLFSGQQQKFGNIADLNLSAASYLGYQKYQLLNRNLNILTPTLFSSSELINTKSPDQTIYLCKKNGYCVPVKKKIQVFNSMSRGFIYMCTIIPQPLNLTCFLLIDLAGKIEGISSNCISLLGIDLKYINIKENIDMIFSRIYANLEKLNKQPEVFLLSSLYQEQIIEKMSIPEVILENSFQIRVNNIIDKGFIVSFSLIKKRFHIQKLYEKNVQLTNFNLTAKKTNSQCLNYIGYIGNDQLISSNFIQYAQDESTPQNAQQIERINYGQSIRIVRLCDNNIQVIQQSQNQNINAIQEEKNKNLSVDIYLKLSRKHQDHIFSNQQTFSKFIQQYQVGKSLKACLLLAFVIHLIIFIVTFILYRIHNTSTITFYNELSYQNLKMGQIQYILSSLYSYKQQSINKSNQDLSDMYSWFNQSILNLQTIKYLGIPPYPVQVTITSNATQTFLIDQFIDSYINNALVVYSGYQNVKQWSDVRTANNTNTYLASQFIFNNGKKIYPQMVNAFQNRATSIRNNLQNLISTQIVIIIISYLIQLIFASVMIYLYSNVYNQKVKVLKIFLGIPQHQILLFSSRSQKFLTSLHIEDNDIDDDDQLLQNQKTKNNYAVKKKFKVIKQQKSIFMKFILVPLLLQIYFIITFYTNCTNISFMQKGIIYVNQTSAGKRVFYNGLSRMQNYILDNTQVINSPTASVYIQYYQSYYENHYNTFAKDPDFHLYFIEIMMLDICAGNIQVPLACNLDLSSNGTLLLFTDMSVYTAYSNLTSDYTDEYYYLNKVVSKSHDILTNQLLSTQRTLTDKTNLNLLNYFFIFLFGSIGIFLFYGIPITNIYLKKINNTKKMLNLLPLSTAKNSDQIHNYFQQIIEKKRYFFN